MLAVPREVGEGEGCLAGVGGGGEGGGGGVGGCGGVGVGENSKRWW